MEDQADPSGRRREVQLTISPEPQDGDSNDAVNSVQDGDSNDAVNSMQEALRKRVQSFIEGLVKMASPVLLALKMNKVDLRRKGNPLVRGIVSPLSAAILGLSIIMFFWLWLCSAQVLNEKVRKFMYTMSKMVVHLCCIFLMVLASCILLIISMDKMLCLFLLFVLVPLIYIIILSGLKNAVRSEGDDESLHKKLKCEDELERSVDFTTSITALVFLGLGHFALEVDDPEKMHVGKELAIAALVCFIICVLGVFFTLCSMIPFLPTNLLCAWLARENKEDDHEKNVRGFLECSNGFIAATVFGVVLWITWKVIMKPWACLLIIPLLVTLFVGLYTYLIKQATNESTQNPQPGTSSGDARLTPVEQQGASSASGETSNAEETMATSTSQPQPPTSSGETSADTRAETKAAPLELTKAAFTSFLLVAIPSFGDSSLPMCTQFFIFLTAAALVSGLLGCVWFTVKVGWDMAVHILLDMAIQFFVWLDEYGDPVFLFGCRDEGWVLRLLTHRTQPPPAIVTAAHIASFCAHLFLFAAVVFFTFMAIRAQTIPPSSPHTCAGAANTTRS